MPRMVCTACRVRIPFGSWRCPRCYGTLGEWEQTFWERWADTLLEAVLGVAIASGFVLLGLLYRLLLTTN